MKALHTETVDSASHSESKGTDNAHLVVTHQPQPALAETPTTDLKPKSKGLENILETDREGKGASSLLAATEPTHSLANPEKSNMVQESIGKSQIDSKDVDLPHPEPFNGRLLSCAFCCAQSAIECGWYGRIATIIFARTSIMVNAITPMAICPSDHVIFPTFTIEQIIAGSIARLPIISV